MGERFRHRNVVSIEMHREFWRSSRQRFQRKVSRIAVRESSSELVEGLLHFCLGDILLVVLEHLALEPGNGAADDFAMSGMQMSGQGTDEGKSF
jgi:hypothetical protein